MGGKRSPHEGLVSIDETIDELAASALQAARDAEKKSEIAKKDGVGKVENPANTPRKPPTSGKNPQD